mgnify:CR=1 FL=1
MLDSIERWVQWAGAAGAAVGLVAVYAGLWRQTHGPRGRATRRLPAVSRMFLQGSFLFYVAMSVVSVGLLYRLWRPIRPMPSASERVGALVLGSLLYFPGVALLLWGRLAMGRMHAVSTSFGAQLYADHRLVTSGPFALVRHPMYLGGILAEVGALLLYRTWATLLIVLNAPVLVRRAGIEERLLAEQFGEQWEEYRRRVPAWMPRLRWPSVVTGGDR